MRAIQRATVARWKPVQATDLIDVEVVGEAEAEDGAVAVGQRRAGAGQGGLELVGELGLQVAERGIVHRRGERGHVRGGHRPLALAGAEQVERGADRGDPHPGDQRAAARVVGDLGR